MMECSHCRTANSPSAVRCSNCNAPFSFDGATLTTGAGVLTPPSSLGEVWPLGTPNSGSGAGASLGVTLQARTVLAGRYEILELLGHGGMGAVYKARDAELDRLVALKVIRPELAADPDVLHRFKQEIILARQVTHKNAIRIFDLGESHGFKFITMEFIEGQDLKRIITEQGKLSRVESVRIVKQVCLALEAAHSEGVVHRDLKPHNIMLDKSGRVFVMDFGVARSTAIPGKTQTGTVIGTPEYMSPEQVMGEHVDARSDLFTLGIIFYELLTGDMPYKAETAQKAMFKRTRELPKPAIQVDPTVPKYLSDVTEKCLQLDLNARYQSAREIHDALDSWRADGSSLKTAAVAPSHGVPLEPKAKLKWRLTLVAVSIVILLAATALIFKRNFAPKSEQKPAATSPPLSLAILPFRNASGDSSVAWLGPSMAEMLSTDVGQSGRLHTVSYDRVTQILHDLGVSPETSIDDGTLRRLSEFSNADTLVTGQYAKFGDQIRIDATVKDLKRNRTASLNAQAAGDKDIPDAVDRLAAAIRQNLDLAPAAVQELKAQSFKPSSNSIPALREYSTGLELVRQGKNLDAVDQLRRSIADDPNFALAFSELAETDAALGKEDAAQEYSRKAVELSGTLPKQEQFLIAAHRNEILKDYPQAIAAYTNYINILPDDADVLFELGHAYESTGAFDKARDLFARVLTLDPKRIDALLAMARVNIDLGDSQIGLDYLNRAQSMAIELGNEEVKAQILQAFGVAYSDLGKREDAMNYFQQSLAIKRRLGLKKEMVASLDSIAVAEGSTGQTETAERDFKEALQLSREIDDAPGTADVLNDSADFYDEHGQYDQALKLLKQSLQIQMDVGNESNQGLVSNNIGNTYMNLGDYNDARPYFVQALTIRQRLNVPMDIADTLHNLAESALDQGPLDQALDQYMKALDLRRSAGDKLGTAVESSSMGVLFGYQGRYGAALSAQEDAVKTLRELKETGFWRTQVLINYGAALGEIGKSDDARKNLDEALSYAREMKNNTQVVQALREEGDSFYYQGAFESASPLYAQAVQAASRTADRTLRLRTKLSETRVAVKRDGTQSAVAVLRTLCGEIDALGSKYLSVECAVTFGEALIGSKAYPKAQQELEGALSRSEQFGFRAMSAKSNYLLGRELHFTGREAEAKEHFAEARRILDEIKKEAGDDSVTKRSDLAPIYATPAE